MLAHGVRPEPSGDALRPAPHLETARADTICAVGRFSRWAWEHSTVRQTFQPGPVHPKRARATVGGTTHRLTWSDRNAGWRMKCSCGWLDSKVRMSERKAVMEGNKHVYAMRDGQGTSLQPAGGPVVTSRAGGRSKTEYPSKQLSDFATQIANATDADVAFIYESTRDISSIDPAGRQILVQEVQRRAAAGSRNRKLVQLDDEMHGATRHVVKYETFMEMVEEYGGLAALAKEAKDSPQGEIGYWHRLCTDGTECPPMSEQEFAEFWAALNRSHSNGQQAD